MNKKMALIEKQKIFSRLLAQFIHDLYRRGYEVTLGEAWRPEEVAEYYAQHARGIAKSNHTSRLAIDLNIFFHKTWLITKEELEIPGKIWKSYTNSLIECCWGGDFEQVDAQHFSIQHNGIK